MTMETDNKLISGMVRDIVDEVAPERVILFGSRARGEAGKTSDVDLIVIEKSPFNKVRNRHSETTRLYRRLSRYLVPKDILVYSSEEVEYWRNSKNHVLARAVRQGKVVYERL